MLNSAPGAYHLYKNPGTNLENITMPDGLIIRDVAQMSPEEIEEECRKLEDAYADALRDNAGFDALSNVWKRIQELQRQISGRDPE